MIHTQQLRPDSKYNCIICFKEDLSNITSLDIVLFYIFKISASRSLWNEPVINHMRQLRPDIIFVSFVSKVDMSNINSLNIVLFDIFEI